MDEDEDAENDPTGASDSGGVALPERDRVEGDEYNGRMRILPSCVYDVVFRV